jgi:branched-chain amino acid transport system substrate-binding protein
VRAATRVGLALIAALLGRGEAGATPRPVTLGLFLPTQGAQGASGREARRGAEMAVERANREGGIQGRAVRLAIASSDLPWGAATSDLVRLIYRENAVAVVGALDGRSAHLAEQVITRARGQAIFVTPWASETTLTQIRIPWFFRLVPDDRLQAGAMLEEIFSVRRVGRVALWVEDGLDAASAAAAFLRRAPAGSTERFEAAAVGSREALARRIDRGEFGALVLCASPGGAADLQGWLGEERRRRVTLVGPLALASPEFLSRARGAAEGMLLVAPSGVGEGPLARAFRREFVKAFGEAPTPLASYTHDAVTLLVEALRRAGPEGGEDLGAILARTSLEGVTGRIDFDRNRSRIGIPTFARVEAAGLVPLSPGVPTEGP